GVTEDDLGYWVKFTYKKVTSENQPYHWRAPFANAQFVEGQHATKLDDKGSFSYGEQELWYLEQAETSTHIVTFETMTREDGLGASKKLQDEALLDYNTPLHALKEIKLFSRIAGATQPIKTVKFEYDYSLCTGAPNSREGK